MYLLFVHLLQQHLWVQLAQAPPGTYQINKINLTQRLCDMSLTVM